MDKKNATLGVLFLIAAFASMYFTARRAPQAPTVPELGNPTQAPASASRPDALGVPTQATPFATAASAQAGASIATLSNNYVDVHLTNFGGAILNIALKKYDLEKALPGSPYVINQRHLDPALGFVELPGLDRNTAYTLMPSGPQEVVFRAVLNNSIEVTRRYSLPAGDGGEGDPYRLRHETTFRNLSIEAVPLPKIGLSVGTAAPLSIHDTGLYLTTGYDSSGDVNFVIRSSLEGSGAFARWFGFRNPPIPSDEKTGSLRWTAVSNQFFTSILTPDKPAFALTTRRVKLDNTLPDDVLNAYGIVGIARFDLGESLAPGAQTALGAGFYAGPKEYTRLANLQVFKADENKVMQFGFFKWFSQILLWLMTWMHSMVGNWGLAIVLTTLVLKIVFMYPTMKAQRSAKQMAKLQQKFQPEFKALKEKYKDNPRKLQTETMELYKKHGMNPAAGCLAMMPILISMPFFMGFYSMLQSTAELRFADFLWTKDLSAPDTIATIYNIPINIMPLLLGATMIVQMRMTPMPTADKTQAAMFKFMPWIFTIFCYNFSCALSLYSTINGLFTIGQQMIVNRMKEPEPATAQGKQVVNPGKDAGRPVKNVTPKKKR